MEDDPVEAYLENMMIGLTPAEKDGLLYAIRSGFTKKQTELTALSAVKPDIIGIILTNINATLHNDAFKELLTRQRNIGISADWLNHQVENGIVHSIDAKMQEVMEGD